MLSLKTSIHVKVFKRVRTNGLVWYEGPTKRPGETEKKEMLVQGAVRPYNSLERSFYRH